MIWMAYLGDSMTLNNKLEKAVFEYLKSIDRTCVYDDGLQDFMEEIESEIDRLNAEHPRCKSINPSWYIYDKKRTWRLGWGKVKFRLYAGKSERL